MNTSEKKILVCDDDEGIADIVKIVLENKAYQVVSMTRTDHIFEEVRKLRPNLILLDLWMPNLGGEEITRHLKQDQKTKDIPIVIISASKDTEQITQRIGADDYLCKPFDIEKLEKIVERYI
ncbi:MAG: response regulator [Patescibacteria group bacterium]|jgi:CheY-like chemotaxis protein